ncbi:MAG: hypothetical protein U0N74_09125 [Peptococcaceae bacterium]|nr:hypothetical protein [Peptococcaceae bacterium]
MEKGEVRHHTADTSALSLKRLTIHKSTAPYRTYKINEHRISSAKCVTDKKMEPCKIVFFDVVTKTSLLR